MKLKFLLKSLIVVSTAAILIGGVEYFNSNGIIAQPTPSESPNSNPNDSNVMPHMSSNGKIKQEFVLRDSWIYKPEVERLLKDAKEFVSQRQHDKAIESYNKIMEHDKEAAMPYYFRGISHLSQKSFDAVASDMQKASELYQKQGKSRLGASLGALSKKIKAKEIPELNK